MPKFDKNTGFTMTMGGNSGSDETSSFSMRDTALVKAAPLYKKVKGIGMAGDSDEDKISTEKLDNITMYARDLSKKRLYPSEVGGTDAKSSPSGGASYSPGDYAGQSTDEIIAGRKKTES